MKILMPLAAITSKPKKILSTPCCTWLYERTMHYFSKTSVNQIRVAIIGGYPPPYGGVSIGVKRLAALLDILRIPYKVYNTASDVEVSKKVVSVARFRSIWSMWYLLACTEDVVILRTSNILAYLLGALLHVLRGKRTVIFFGNMTILSSAKQHSGTISSKLLKWTLRHADVTVGVSEQICHTLIELGATHEKLKHIPGILFPPNRFLYDNVDQRIAGFIRNHSPKLLAMVAFNRGPIGWHIYGLDLILDVMVSIRKKFEKIGLVLVIPALSKGLKENLPKILEELRNRHLGETVLPYVLAEEMYPLFHLVDVYWRPTRTDGDANSIRESLYASTPVLASDCVPRPEPVRLHNSGDFESCRWALEEILQNLPEIKAQIKNMQTSDSREKYTELITDLLEECL